MTFKSILKRYSVGARFGAATINVEELRKDLRQVSARNNVYLWVYLAMVVALFVIFVRYVQSTPGDAVKVGVASTALGGSATGIAALILKVWREKTRTEMLLALAINLRDGAMLRAIMRSLLRGVFRDGADDDDAAPALNAQREVEG